MIRISLILLLTATLAWGTGPDPFPRAAASYCVQVNGKELWSHNPARRLPPASLTKVMTVLLALERDRPEEVVTVSPGAARETGSVLGLKRGEKMRVIDLVAAALLSSANDACRALADHLAGSEEHFVALMNTKARELGLTDTKFMNACGHNQEGHYSTAHDLAILARAAMANSLYAPLAATVRLRIRTINGKREFLLENKNELIGRYEGACGVKTGTTPDAGKCLVAMAERNGTSVLLVLLNAPDRWWQAVAILDRAFALPARSAGGAPP